VFYNTMRSPRRSLLPIPQHCALLQCGHNHCTFSSVKSARVPTHIDTSIRMKRTRHRVDTITAVHLRCGSFKYFPQEFPYTVRGITQFACDSSSVTCGIISDDAMTLPVVIAPATLARKHIRDLSCTINVS
jgi:hypothetical protein